MTRDQEDKRSMYEALRAFYLQNQPTLQAVPSLGQAYNLHSEMLDELNDLAEQQLQHSKGPRQNKQNAKEILVPQIFAVKGMLRAYGNAIGNQEIVQQHSQSQTFLRNLPDTELVDAARFTHNQAAARLTELAPYGLTTGILDDLDTATENYRIAAPGPTNQTATQTQITAAIAALYKRIDQNIKINIESLMRVFIINDSVLYQTFLNTIKIRNTGYRSETKTGTLNPSESRTIKTREISELTQFQITNNGPGQIRVCMQAEPNAPCPTSSPELIAGDVKIIQPSALGPGPNLTLTNTSTTLKAQYKIVRQKSTA